MSFNYNINHLQHGHIQDGFLGGAFGCKQFLSFENGSYFSKTKFRKFGFFKLKMTINNGKIIFLLILIKYG